VRIRAPPGWGEPPIERVSTGSDDVFVPRLLVLCRQPQHLPREEAEVWLRQELDSVLNRDRMDWTTLTRLASPPPAQWTRAFDWLIEFRFADRASTALGPAAACVELVADLRLLGMAPTVVLAEDQVAIRLQRS
jgi:hypothetical protein